MTLTRRKRLGAKAEAGGAGEDDSPAKRGRRAGGALSLYDVPPTAEVTIPQFEEYAVHRLHVLREVEKMRAQGTERGAYRSRVMELCRKYGLNEPEKDRTSHFVVRLAYCGSEDLRQWLRQQECRLFQARFEESTRADVEAFFERHGMQYRPHRPDNDQLRGLLQRTAVATGVSVARSGDVEYFRVPFEEAIDLVGQRRVLLRDGFAYVPREQLVNLVVNKYRAHLGKELATTYRWTQNTVLDDRVRPLVRSLSKRHTGPAYKPKGLASGQVTPAQVPELAKRSFPLCMSTMQAQLKKDAHLKHEGRRTYGLFLKGIGLSLDDAVKFWRDSFARKMTADKFQRNHVYNIRHMYGKEGRRKDYTPLSCMSIIHAAQGNGEYHSCPFRHENSGSLRNKLLKKGVSPKDVEGVMGLVDGRHYQLACQAVFKATHPGNPAYEVGNHPNEYFEASAKHWREKAEAADAAKAAAGGGDGGGGGSGAAKVEPKTETPRKGGAMHVDG